MPYLLDSNVFIQAKNLHYGFDFCPAFWEWLDRENNAGLVASVEKVGIEILAGNDDLAQWATAIGVRFFQPPDAKVLTALNTVSTWVMDQHYASAAVDTFLQIADYYLVAQALASGATVVSHERPENSIRKVKIPNVCIGLGVTCINPFEMLRREHARFVLGRAS